MSEDNRIPRPPDERLFLYSVALQIVQWPIIRNMIGAVRLILFGVSPSVPVFLTDSLKRTPPRRGLLSGVVLGLVFCLGGTIVLASIDGTFSGSDPTRTYLIEDWPNLVNYAFLCPLYIGLSAHLIVLVLTGWPTLVSIPLQSAKQFSLPKRSLAFTLFVILSVSVGFTLNYVRESIDPSVYPKVGWWVSQTGVGGERLLGLIGTYYAILNFVLLGVCLTALLAFLSMFFLCIRVGRGLASETESNTLDFDGLRTCLRHFTESYLSVKLLASVLMLNAYTWKFEKPLASFNMVAMGLALALFGVFFVSIPRYYVELEWFKFKARRALAQGAEPSMLRDDLRPFGTRVVAQVIDVLIVSGFILTFFTWQP